MKIVARSVIAILSLFSLLGAPGSSVPAGLTPMPPVTCNSEEDLVIENRYIKTSGNGIEVSGNCSVEVKNSHIVADGYAVLVDFNGTVEITGSRIEGGKAAFRVAGNGDIYYEGSHVRGRIETALNGEIEDGGDNSRDHEPERTAGGLGEMEALEAINALEDWRVHADAAVYDLARVLTELRAVSEGDRLRLHLAGDILFDFDSDQIRPSAAAELAKVAHVLRQRAVGEIVLEGHTDSVGSPKYNLTLSQARAAAVRQWLNEKEAVPLQLMVARGWGEEKPVAYNTMPDGSDNPAGRAENRRVEISFVSRQPAASPQGADGVSLRGGAAEVEVRRVEPQPLPSSQPEEACAEICSRWPDLDETEVSCITTALLLNGYDVYDHNACLAVDSTRGCKLCWQKLQVSEQDCARLTRLCAPR